MFKKIFITFLVILLSFGAVNATNDNADNSTDTLRVVDLNTFNEYKFRISNAYLDFKNKFKVNNKIDSITAKKMLDLAKEGYNFLPDSLTNKNYYFNLKTAIEKGIKYPNNANNFDAISTAAEDYLYKTRIDSIKGSVESFPSTGNAPLTVTLRGNVKDPTGTKLENYNYVWWINEGGKRKVIGNKISLNYVFKEEGNYSVFLDVTSNHKNAKGFTDVLPFSSRADIVVKEKIASIILNVNSKSLRQKDELKFTPDEARYGLVFDATSSTPTSGSKFTRTEWDFGNGVEKTYNGGPQIERVKYVSEGDFTVKLKLRTNEGKTVERKFSLKIHNPIATIDEVNTDGYLGDKYRFNANPGNNDDENLTYNWEIVDTVKDEVVFRKNTKTFTYTFNKKGKYNVKLFVTEPSGDTDLDYKIIYINSRAPEASINHSKPFLHKPNTVFLDASKSFDPDYTDDGKLKFSWVINGQRVDLEDPNFNGSNGYYTFDSVGEHSVVVEVTDPDNITSQAKQKVEVKSILSVEFFAFPRVVQRDKTIRLVADSPEAKYFEWNFGDGNIEGDSDENMTHVFKKSGVYNVKLRVVDENDKENTFTKKIFVGDSDMPYAFINVKDNLGDIANRPNACNGKDAYIVNRVDTITFDGSESLDVTGKNTGISYTWKLGNSLYSSQSFNKKFDELGCFPVKLTVKSDKNGKADSKTIYLKVENIKPSFLNLDVKVKNYESDPVIVDVTALGAKDRDGVIQSYLWYYYTDVDSNPQDFRATRSPNTSFVLPKISGNYYFVVVMKDNNEARVNSEEASSARYFVSLAGDNINTPIVGLSVNDNSVSIGDEIAFSTTVENVLGIKLNKDVKYKWDFDGDGFYDKETTTPNTTHVYQKSGEKYAKVKVSYKGYSNTKSVVINVANILKPDFDYISVGNKFTFIDKSSGVGAKYTWDLGDGTIVENKKNFTHEYTDGKSSHKVSLKLTEGTNIKIAERKVVKNMKNYLQANRGGLVLFTSPNAENEEIVLENDGEKVFFYLGASSGDIANYVVDYDINYDSNINGTEDDDKDNKNYDSFTSGESISIELNNSKEQVVRAYLLDSEGNTISTKDVKIIKNYVEEEIDLGSIQFEGVSDSVREKLEKLKNEVTDFPKEYKLKGQAYVQRLKEEWNDDREKTNIILEFIGFISEIQISNSEELNNLLESLLVEGEEDKSEKAVALNALKNLIPKNISCETGDENVNCYDSLVAKLEVINENNIVDENRELGSQILKVIAKDSTMSVKQKTDFKAILNTFVYGGLQNIPDEVKNEELPEDEPKDNGEPSKILGIFTTILKVIFGLVAVIAGLIGLFYVYFLSARKGNISFSDFILQKTSSGNNSSQTADIADDLDILDDLKTEVKEEKIEEKNDIFSNETKEEKTQETKEEIPTWLKGNFSEDPLSEVSKTKIEGKEVPEVKEEKAEEIKESPKVEETKVEETSGDVPDWLKGSFEETPKAEEKEVSETKEEVPEVKEEKTEETPKIEETKVEETSGDVPDWLKGSFEETPKTEEKEVSETKEEAPEVKEEKTEEEPKVEEEKLEEEPKLETKEDLDEFTKLDEPVKTEVKNEENKSKDDDGLPDWLKGSFDETPKSEEKEVPETKEEVPELKEEKTSETQKVEEVKEDAKEVEKEVSETPKVEETKKETPKNKAKDLEQNSKTKNVSNKTEKKLDKKQEEKEENKTPKKTSNNRRRNSSNRQKNNSGNIKNNSEENKKETKVVLNKPKVTKNNDTKVKKEDSSIKKQSEVKKTDDKIKKSENNQNNKSKNSENELWDDGMKVPDWLKTDDK